MANTDFDPQDQAPPPPPPSRPFAPQLTQLAQQAAPPPAPPQPPPQQPPTAKDQSRLPGGGINWTTRNNMAVFQAPEERPVGNVPLPTPRPPEAPQQLPPVVVKPPQAYVPSPIRKMEQWGDDYWAIERMKNDPDFSRTQFMPTEQEASGVLRGANKQLATFSAPAIAGPAGVVAGLASIVGPFMDFFSHNAFSEHYRKVALGGTQQQLAELKLKEGYFRLHEDELRAKHDRMMDVQDDLTKTHYDMLTEYRSVFDDLKSGAITQETAENNIRALNQKWHHQNFDNAMDNGGLGAVSNGLNLEHQKFMHSWAGNTSLRSADKTRKEADKEREKVEKRSELEAPYRGDDTGAAPAGRESGGVMGYTPPQAAAGAAPVAEPAEPGQPDLAQSPALNKAASVGLKNSQTINDLAEQILTGEAKKTDFKGNERVWGFANERASEMRSQLREIKNNSELTNKAAVLDAIGGVSPAMKDRVDAILTGGASAPRAGTAGSLKEPWSTAYALAKKAEPRIDTILKTRDGTLKYFTSGLGARQEAQLGTAYQHGDALLETMSRPPPLWEKAALFVGPKVVRDYLYPEASAWVGEVEKNIQVFASETGAVLAYGQGTGREREELKSGMDWTTPNRTMAAVKTQMKRLRDREENLAHDFAMGTGRSYGDFRAGFRDIDPTIVEGNPGAEDGISAMARDRVKDHEVHDFRTYAPGAQ